MTVIHPTLARLDPASAAPLVADLGFLASPDLPDRPGPAYLVLALRAAPTLQHYDPEQVHYWVTEHDRGVSRTLTRDTQLPLETDFSWGPIRIVDRLRVTNEFLTFGGHLSVRSIEDVVIAVFTSPAPLLRRGGHSQGWDWGAEILGGYFGRFMTAVDYSPGFEARAALADPATRYAAFLADTLARHRASAALREAEQDRWTLLQSEERRLRQTDPGAWAAGEKLARQATW